MYTGMETCSLSIKPKGLYAQLECPCVWSQFWNRNVVGHFTRIAERPGRKQAAWDPPKYREQDVSKFRST